MPDAPDISFPRMCTEPDVGVSKPAIIRSRVVLPQPLVPNIETISPGQTSRSADSTARVSPNRFVSARPRITGVSILYLFRSLSIRTAMGTDELNMSIRAGAAAWAKKASDEADHTAVARVLNPSGPSISVAGSSFIVTRKTNAPPISIPGLIRGPVTESITRNCPLPRILADSSNRGLI